MFHKVVYSQSIKALYSVRRNNVTEMKIQIEPFFIKIFPKFNIFVFPQNWIFDM